jgi:DivIVA domain-containing protein
MRSRYRTRTVFPVRGSAPRWTLQPAPGHVHQFPVILGAVAKRESLERNQTDDEQSPGSVQEDDGATELRRVAAEIRAASFPASLRGYDREAVDAYVARVNYLIAELDVSGSPEAAVRHALEQVGEQTRSLLERAGQTAEEITVGARREAKESSARANAEAGEIVAKAKAEADEILGHSKAEAETIAARTRQEAAERLHRSRDEVAALQEEAEARMRELEADTENIRQQRRALLDDLRGIAAQTADTASNAEARFPAPEPAALPEEATADLEPETESRDVEAADKPHGGKAGRQVPPGR